MNSQTCGFFIYMTAFIAGASQTGARTKHMRTLLGTLPSAMAVTLANINGTAPSTGEVMNVSLPQYKQHIEKHK